MIGSALRSLPVTFCFFAALLSPMVVHAEGSLGPEPDSTQALRSSTDVYADILDFNIETIVWTGKGDVEVTDPAGTVIGTFGPGDTITPTMNGAYVLDLQEHQYDENVVTNPDGTVTRTIIPSTIVEWDVTVFVSGVARIGRVYSFAWAFNTGAFSVAASTNASFYARVPGGDAESFAVMELRTDGLAGYIFEIQGNSTGVRGTNAGRSVPETGHSAANEYQIYLNPPDRASYTFLAPTVRDFTFTGGLEIDGGVATCDEFVAGSTQGEFSFTSNVEGSFHLICDLNDDGEFDIVDDGDFLILGSAMVGVNDVPFDGLDNNGDPFPVGDHECMVRVTVGEFHYVGRDIETSFIGLRMFQVRNDRVRTPLAMYWNDALVQSNAITMPAGPGGTFPSFAFIAASTSGPTGLSSGDPSDPPIPLGESVVLTGANARAWGDFVSVGGSGTGKGNEAYLDTYTWLDEALSAPITIHSVDGTLDTDNEGLTDYVERCITGTDYLDADSDDDTVNDFVETGGGMPGINTDMDSMIDALDPDDDDDCIPTALEDPDGDGDPTNDHSDTDGQPDYLDNDDDGDGLGSCMEDPDGDGDPTNDDSDGDGIPNYREADSDDDCATRPTLPEVQCRDGMDECPWVPETVNGYEDDDGCPEPDQDGDGVPDAIDNCVFTPNTDQEDLDGDMIGDVCDDDIDGDGLLNNCESPAGMCPFDCAIVCTDDYPDCNGCAETDPRDPDTDDGGMLDLPEVIRGSDPLDPEDDPLPGLLTGGGVFSCRSASGGGHPSGVLFMLSILGLLAWRRRR